MNRRELLASLGTMSGAVSLAGCFEEPAVTCEPQEGDVRVGSIDTSSSSTITFRGAAANLSDSVVIDDTTGIALLKSGDEQYIQADNIKVGNCLSGEGVISPEASWKNRLPVVTVTALELLGQSERSVDERSNRPATDFVVEIERVGDCESRVRLRHAGGQPVRAEHLLIAQRGVETAFSDEQKTWWYELDEETEPWAMVSEGDSVTISQTANTVGTLAWVNDWSVQLQGWQTDEC